MKNALKDACKNAAMFGMHFKEIDITSSTLRTISAADENEDENDSEQLFEDSPRNSLNASHSKSNEPTDISKFVQLTDSDGTVKEVKKSTFIWMLTNTKGKLSTDRLKRVQGNSSCSGQPKKKKKRQKTSSESSGKYNGQFLFKFEDLECHTWAIFGINNENYQHIESEIEIGACIIGIVLGFKTIGEKGKVIQYKLNYAPTPISKKFKTNVQVLRTKWHFDSYSNEKENISPYR